MAKRQPKTCFHIVIKCSPEQFHLYIPKSKQKESGEPPSAMSVMNIGKFCPPLKSIPFACFCTFVFSPSNFYRFLSCPICVFNISIIWGGGGGAPYCSQKTTEYLPVPNGLFKSILSIWQKRQAWESESHKFACVMSF